MISPGAAMVYLCRKLAFNAIKSFERSEPFSTMLLLSRQILLPKRQKPMIIASTTTATTTFD
jgi:hypothetical protein